MRITRGMLSLLVLGASASCAPDAATPADDGTLRVGAILAPGEGSGSARRGAELGALEASRAGELIGRPFELLVREAASPREIRNAVEGLVDEGVFAVIGGSDVAGCGEIGAAAEELAILFLNTGCRDEELRGESTATTFHVEASERIYREAAQAAGDPAASAEAMLWHSGLERFGAAQLNERFERQFALPADGDSWATWMAIKILWESANRVRGTDSRALAAYLLDEATAFDGHKGQSLTFSPDQHQLRQPLYFSASFEGATVPVEVDPMTGEAAGMSVDEWEALEGRGVPEGRYLAVSNEGSGDVVVVDLEGGEVVSRVRVGSRPRGIRAAIDGRLVYVALSDDAPTVETDEDAVAVIDLSTGQVTSRFPVGTDPEVFDLSPDGRYLYASNEDAGTATVTDLVSREVLATLAVGIEPEGVATSPDGRWVYITAETSNTVSVIDTRTNEVAASFLVDVRPRAATFSPGGDRAYITNEISATLSVVDTDTHSVIDVVEMPAEATPVGVVASPDGRRVYVANGHANSVSVIDAATNEVVAEVPVGRRPWGIAVSEDGTRIYTANGLTNDVSVIDAVSLRVIDTIGVGQRPWGLAVVE